MPAGRILAAVMSIVAGFAGRPVAGVVGLELAFALVHR